MAVESNDGRASNDGLCMLAVGVTDPEREEREAFAARARARNFTFANSTRYGMPKELKRISGAISNACSEMRRGIVPMPDWIKGKVRPTWG